MLKINPSRNSGKAFKFLFVVLFGVVVSVNLSAFVSSRIEGVVVDKETGKPIEGAEVRLYERLGYGNARMKMIRVMHTDKKGYFKADMNLMGRVRYFHIVVSKRGYAVHGSVNPYVKEKKEEELRGVRVNIPDAVRKTEEGPVAPRAWIELNEGEIKHVKIGMSKEAVLEVNIGYRWLPEIGEIKKDSVGKYKNRVCIIELSYEGVNNCFGVNEHFKLRGFGSGEIEIEIYTKLIGWPKVVYKRKVKGGEKVVINHVFDLTKGGVVYGKLSKCYSSIGIGIENDDDSWAEANKNDREMYVIGGLSEGVYLINADNECKNKWYIKYIEIKKGEIKRLDIK